MAMEALRCPPEGRRRHQAVGRRAPPRGALPAAARTARPAAARRADQPSRRRDHGVAGKAPARLSGRGADHHPRPLLPRQRHRLDSRARPRPRHPLRGQLHRLSRRQGQAPASRKAARTTPARRRSGASASGSRPRPKARQTKSKARIKAYEDLVEQADKRRPSDTQIVIPHGERLGNVVIEVEGLDKGYGDELLIEDLVLQAAAGRHRRHHRPERRRQDDAVPHDHRPGEAGRRLDPHRRDGEARLCRPEPRRARPEQDRLGGDLRRRRSRQARQARGQHAAPTARPSTSAAATSSRRSATSRAASATACTWPRC